MNNVILIGNLAADPEARTTQSGVKCAQFRLAVQREFKNQQGTYDADFFNITCWRQTAEFVTNYLRKGNKCAIRGYLQNRTYEGQDGIKRYVTDIIAERVQSLVSVRHDTGLPEEPNYPVQGQTDSRGFTEVQDDELPF